MHDIMGYAGLKPAEQFIYQTAASSYLISNQGEWFDQPVKNNEPNLWQGKIGIGASCPLLKNTNVAIAYSGNNGQRVVDYIDNLFKGKIQTNVTEEIAKTLRPIFDFIADDFCIAIISKHFKDSIVAISRGRTLFYTAFGHLSTSINSFAGLASKACRLKDLDIVILSPGGQYISPWRDTEPSLETIPVLQLEDRRQELESLAKDICKYNKYIYLSTDVYYNTALKACNKIKQSTSIDTQIFLSTKPLPDNAIDKSNVNIFLCAAQQLLDVSTIVNNMNKIKRAGGLILSITDPYSWGWAQKYTDYSFVIQPSMFNVSLDILVECIVLKRQSI